MILKSTLPQLRSQVFFLDQNMKKKIVIRVQVDCDKCRSKALKIAAEAPGVSSVSIEGDDRDKLVVTGEVDAVCLAKILRKKFKCVTLVSVEDVKKPPEKKPEEKKKEEPCKSICCHPPPCPPPPCHPCPPPCHWFYDDHAGNCFMM